MTLDQMCQEAARLSDRYDEFEKTENEDGRMVYEEDAGHYFNVFRDGMNEAYAEVARRYVKPDIYVQATVGEDGIVQLDELDPMVYAVLNVFDETRDRQVQFKFETKFQIKTNEEAGTVITLFYQYVPDKMKGYSDEPIFPESMVDPMIYISLAVARMWLSEKKRELYHEWMNQYQTLLMQCRKDLRHQSLRRIPRRTFR